MCSYSIESIECYSVRIGEGDDDDIKFRSEERDTFPGTNYFLNEAGFVYSTCIEQLLVKVTAENGEHGWGEVQAPVVPDVPRRLIQDMLGPMVLGMDPLKTDEIWKRMYESMNIRGHFLGFMIDAMAGIDIALWDLKGKLLSESVATLLGGRQREQLSAYVTGGDLEHFDQGFGGIKVGVHGADDLPLSIDLDRAPSPAAVKVDNHWRFKSAHEAIRVNRRLEELGLGFIEAPLPPEDIDGAARVATALDVPVALGESLRTTHDFKIRLDREAFDIGQPDINRTGITEGRRIADLLDEHGRPTAPHVGGSLGVAMAATWQLSAAISNFGIQEHQHARFEASNGFLDPELSIEDGDLVVPEGPGLGIDVDEDALAPHVTASSRCTR
jgi:L-alanine-DL-glutamate epimerase-like enolase superfamily enzyme